MKATAFNGFIAYFKRPYRYAVFFSILLTAAFAFTLLDAFVIPKTMAAARSDAPETEPSLVSAVTTDYSYKDENIEIVIDTIRVYDTQVYIADVKVSDAAYLKTAFADNAYGRNLTDKTSVIASENNAVFAVNGDYYGFRDSGWVFRNGVLYRSGQDVESLLMDVDGNLSCETDENIISEMTEGLSQVWSFGPALVRDGEISVTETQEISGKSGRQGRGGQSSSGGNPRTAIGQAGELHYIFIVSDGRTSESEGLSLYELAGLFIERGCHVAYNLDGGGSATMYFNGKVINSPTTSGRSIQEREVSDIVYIGY